MVAVAVNDIAGIQRFLQCETPQGWIDNALANPDVMLIDHANCEKKAASTALNLIYRYVDKYELMNKMSKLAREELRHFEQVIKIMRRRNIQYTQITSARYAGKLRESVRTFEPAKLVDTLIVGAYIEARSCERFAALAPHLDSELSAFYRSLLKSESRHFEDYLKLAERYSEGPITDRIVHFGEVEKELILSPDDTFRFHSGPLAS